MSPPTHAPVNYAVARLRAERALVALHHREARILVDERGYASGTIELVARHRAEYARLYRSEVARLDGLAGRKAAFTAPLRIGGSGMPQTTEQLAAGGSA